MHAALRGDVLTCLLPALKVACMRARKSGQNELLMACVRAWCADIILRGLIKYWPHTNSSKEVM